MSWISVPFSLALFIISAFTASITLPLPIGANTSSLRYQPGGSLAITSQDTAAAPLNSTHIPVRFLGVNCYYLKPHTVNLQACQPLFASLVAGGNVYEKKELGNRSRFRFDNEPCTIEIKSPNREDRKVSISIADIILLATEVLETCKKTSTGGAYTFEGAWQVAVTRDVTYDARLGSEIL
ncbi:hypothetical protein ACLMJK_001141 [Lecanora helva]